mmetsp:Transcript_1151/g.3229  ORF Transcript_1151/g.3229 Transcript_1151/m.3229 type:complete len:133 (-) Transcript_1151:3333-3731(-)
MNGCREVARGDQGSSRSACHLGKKNQPVDRRNPCASSTVTEIVLFPLLNLVAEHQDLGFLRRLLCGGSEASRPLPVGSLYPQVGKMRLFRGRLTPDFTSPSVLFLLVGVELSQSSCRLPFSSHALTEAKHAV